MNITSPPLTGLDPAQEQARLGEIAELGLLSSRTNPALQRAVDAAAKEFDVPTAMISIVLDDVQYFAAMSGVEGWMQEAQGTPLEWSFCLNTVRTRKPFVVSDAFVDDRMKDSPLVQIDGIRSYAGAPLLSSNGHALGAFCVLGAEVRQFTASDIERLEGFARRVVAEIEAGKLLTAGKIGRGLACGNP